MLRPTCLLCHLYELPTSATLRFSQEFVDGINLRVRIVLQANVGSKYCVRDSAPGETLPRYAETVQHFWIVDETRRLHQLMNCWYYAIFLPTQWSRVSLKFGSTVMHHS